MADYTIAADEIGAYEISLNPNEVTVVRFEAQDVKVGVVAHVIVHMADSPVYVRGNTDVSVRDPKSVVVDAGTWADVPLTDRDGATIAIVAASAAVVSVARA